MLQIVKCTKRKLHNFCIEGGWAGVGEQGRCPTYPPFSLSDPPLSVVWMGRAGPISVRVCVCICVRVGVYLEEGGAMCTWSLWADPSTR